MVNIEKKWYEDFKATNVECNFEFSNDMELEYKYGRDLYNNEYREKHGMIKVIDYDVESIMNQYGEWN